ncbi:MAG TPA: DbpA RNA binding domain-containing protein, partial [Magnetospirillaceae bacterium]|nr:DbpA RNA binding domain-containing protein [Magnetospirillaceae bacterium]
RFTSENVLRVLSGISGIEESDVGAIRTFDHYTFVNVHPAAADLIIQDADGASFKGRKLAVNRARPRKEDEKSGKPETRSDAPETPAEGPSKA